MNVGSVFGKDYSACVQGDVRAISGAGVAWRGKGSLPSRRDVLEGSNDDRFDNYYNHYGGYANPGEFVKNLRYRYSHTIGYTSDWFFTASGKKLREAKGEGDDYDSVDVANAYGITYAGRFREIEDRYGDGREQWFDIDGTPLTREKEMAYLEEAYENAVAFQVSSARVMAGLRQMTEASQEDLRNTFYRARDRYMELYKEGGMTGGQVVSQRV